MLVPRTAMASKRKTFIIIDGHALLHRAWHALPPLTTKKGVVVNAVYGFTTVLLKIFKDLHPDYSAVAFDVAAPTFRHKRFAAYKAHREKQPQELYDQLPILKDVLRAFRVAIFEKKGYEADDVIGTLTALAGSTDNIIVTGDQDTLQLIDAHTWVYAMQKGISEFAIYDAQAVQDRYALDVAQLIDYKALRGDPSDNIPGVQGVGEKTATDLLQQFGSLEELYRHLETATSKARKLKPAVREKLLTHQHDAFQSKELATIVRDVAIPFNLDDCAVQPPDRERAVALFQELSFASLMKNIPHSGDATSHVRKNAKLPRGYRLITKRADFEELLKLLAAAPAFALDTETTSLNTLDAKVLGISVSTKVGEAAYCALPDAAGERQKWLAAAKLVLENRHIVKIGHNLKYDMEVLANDGIRVAEPLFDTMVASYLLNTQSRGNDLDTLTLLEYGHTMIPLERLLGPKGKDQKTMDEIPPTEVAEYACEDADYAWRLYEKFLPRLKKERMETLFTDMEMQLITVLVAMEREGIAVDMSFLREMSMHLKKRITSLERNIYALAGSEFNIASPLQLKKILFTDLGIDPKGLAKIKTGISTAASELEKLKGIHAIIPLISDFREVTKLLSTYVDALPKLVRKDTGRVHTSYNQTVAATGRLSSSDPNLQNIPIRTEIGKKIRKSFIAKKGSELLAADYSQIELRIVASLAHDRKMLAAFHKDQDIHATTAAEIAGCSLEEVTPEMRRKAKTVNFGVLYGMGAHGLAASADITYAEAREFIGAYFTLYKGVAKYMEDTKAFARTHGYVKTLFGRVRYFPDILSGLPQVRAQAERMAINMPVQGTAADIMKYAMIKLHRLLDPDEAKILLQVHDELVLEVRKGFAEKTAKTVRVCMEGVHQLAAPLKVNITVGRNWGEMKEFTS